MKKILVANRGEIACRVFKTAKKMGIPTVAVYSDADKKSLHVSMADEAIHIGLPAAKDSYLAIDKIISACKEVGADAVHPGYGFLSERAEFCELLECEGITFIGPPASAIKAMGDKITSKKIAQEAGVSTIPGYMGLIENGEHAVKIARTIGYPVMIKASAGGGGKGMRVAWGDEETREGYERSKSEAQSSFGDDRIFIEKFVVEPRHIEIQVLADQHGQCIYLGERECSIQRRNQKVIEEAPSSFLDEKTRQAMGEQACALSQAVGYTSAGTVEFIVDKDKNFYFLEMNTRLQVEHPVTEMVTGIDLVEQMISIADGKKLSLKQKNVTLNGWAMESRIYAEDPYRNFLPSIGRLTCYRPPAELNSDALIVRNDTGVYEGSEISMFYDPMLAKLCTWAPLRSLAIDAMKQALDGFQIEGIAHNLPFLSALMSHDRFRSGHITTAFIAEEYPDGFKGVSASAELANILYATATVITRMKYERIWSRDTMFVVDRPVVQDWVIRCNRVNMPIRLYVNTDDYKVIINEQTLTISTAYNLGERLAEINVNGVPYCIKVDRIIGGYRLRMRGIDLEIQVLESHVAELADLMPEKSEADTSKLLLCPMPGLVVSLMVEVGHKVEKGQPLAMIEAMKMENVLRAQRAAIISKIPVTEGDSLAVDDIIMEFE